MHALLGQGFLSLQGSSFMSIMVQIRYHTSSLVECLRSPVSSYHAAQSETLHIAFAKCAARVDPWECHGWALRSTVANPRAGEDGCSSSKFIRTRRESADRRQRFQKAGLPGKTGPKLSQIGTRLAGSFSWAMDSG